MTCVPDGILAHVQDSTERSSVKGPAAQWEPTSSRLFNLIICVYIYIKYILIHKSYHISSSGFYIFYMFISVIRFGAFAFVFFMASYIFSHVQLMESNGSPRFPFINIFKYVHFYRMYFIDFPTFPTCPNMFQYFPLLSNLFHIQHSPRCFYNISRIFPTLSTISHSFFHGFSHAIAIGRLHPWCDAVLRWCHAARRARNDPFAWNECVNSRRDSGDDQRYLATKT